MCQNKWFPPPKLCRRRSMLPAYAKINRLPVPRQTLIVSCTQSSGKRKADRLAGVTLPPRPFARDACGPYHVGHRPAK